MRLKRPLVVHPLLLACVPVLVLWASNLKESVPLGDVLRPLGLIVGVALLLLIVLGLAFRGNWMKAGLVVSILVFLFFSFGEVHEAVSGVPVLGSQPIGLAVWGALAVVGISAVVRAGPRRLPGLTKGLNFVAAGLVVVNLASIGAYKFQTRGGPVTASNVLDIPSSKAPPTSSPTSSTSRKPDIYYIMLEEYAGSKALHDLFHFDNSPFLDFLKDRGFYVVEHATTNYPHTADSLAASLNLQYVQQMVKPTAKNGDDWAVVENLIRNDEVPRLLKSKGYTYIHVGSRWTPTATNPQADVNIKLPGSLSEFSQSLLRTTALEPRSNLYNYKRVEIRFQFQQLAKLPKVGGQKFVFCHILIPHLPYLFDAKGGAVSDAEARNNNPYNYLQQLQYANKLTQQAIDALLSGYPPQLRPIIVLQSDEGPYTGLNEGTSVTNDELEQHFGILSAYYFPGLDQTGLYPHITPVNSFRLLFDDYFGANLSLLPDQNYVFVDEEHLYRFIDVTDRVLALS